MSKFSNLFTSSQLFQARETFYKNGNMFNKPQFKSSYLKLGFMGILGILIFAVIIIFFKNSNGASVNNAQGKPAAPVAKAIINIEKEFNFPIKDADNKEISKIKYAVQSASIQDEILIKGERARAVKGRTFLIINLKITNTYKQGIQINSRDYVRLVINGNKKELIAADIHNDPVEVQAISTKITRIGFPINEKDKDLELQVGEISGKKEIVKIPFN